MEKKFGIHKRFKKRRRMYKTFTDTNYDEIRGEVDQPIRMQPLTPKSTVVKKRKTQTERDSPTQKRSQS